MDAAQAAVAAPQQAPPPAGAPSGLPPGITTAPAAPLSGDPAAAQPARRRSKFSAEPPSGVMSSAPPNAQGAAAPAALPSAVPPGLPAHVPPAYAPPATAVGPAHHAVQQASPPAQAPPFAPTPADTALAQRISKLAEFVSRNGPAFEQQVRAKQGGNAEYAFLQGGAGSEYYQWCLFCMPRQLPLDRPLEATPPGGQVAGGAMPEAVSSGFAQVLNVLHGSQVRQCQYPGIRFAGQLDTACPQGQLCLRDVCSSSSRTRVAFDFV